MEILDLTPDELLSTTRTVRRRLDLSRPVEREVIERCIALAQQAPSGSNQQQFHFVVVSDPERRRALGELFRRGLEIYRTLPIAVHNLSYHEPASSGPQRRSSRRSSIWPHTSRMFRYMCSPVSRARSSGSDPSSWAG